MTPASDTPRGQVRDRVEPGSEPGQLDSRRVPGEGLGQYVAALRVLGPHPAQVPVVPAGLQQDGERELVEPGAAAVAVVLARRYRGDQVRRAEHPAQAHGRRE